MVHTVPVSLEVPKEGKDVIDAATGIFADVKAKKPVSEVMAGNLTKLFAAIEGFNLLSEEMKSKYRSDLAAYLTKGLMDALIPGSPSA